MAANFYSNINGAFFVTTSGTVGIGAYTATDTLGANLNIKSNSAQIQLESTNGSGATYIISSVSNGSFAITKSGVGDRLLIDSSGNSTFAGSVTGTLARFDTLNNNANSANIIYRSGTNTIVGNNASALVVQDGGNVGIGTDSPGAKLEISDTNKAINTPGNLFVSTTDTLAVDKGGQISLGGVWSGTSKIQFAGIAGRKENATSGNAGGYLQLSTTNSSGGALTERMRINSGGNVGIGETSIDARLHISALASNGISNIKLESPGASKWAFGIPASQTYFALDDTNDNLSTPKLVVLKTTGNVGIGTTAPGERLEVSGGHLKITNSGNTNLYINANNAGSDATIFFEEQDSVKAKIQHDASNDSMLFTDGAYTDTLTLKGGNVGIGTISPQTKLEVNGGLVKIVENSNTAFYSGDYVRVFGTQSYGFRNSGGSSIALISLNGNSYFNGGNVGIGTTSPANKLDVQITTANRTTLEPVLSVSASGSGPYTGFGPKISFSSNIYYGAATGNPAGIIETAYIGAVMGSDYANDSDLVFGTRQSATTVSEKMRILGNGNVGIGTGSFDGIETQLKIAQMSSGVVGDIFDASKSQNAGRLIICGQNHSPMLSMRHYSASYGFDIWVDVASTWDTYFDVRQQTSGFRWRGYTANNGGEVPLMHLDRYGTLTVTGDIVAYGSPSDKRLKQNIKPIKSALDKAMKLQGVTFNWKKSDSLLDIKQDIGFIAQDVQKVLPELVRENEDGMLSMRHQGIAPILLEAIKELKTEMESLKLEIKTLKNK